VAAVTASVVLCCTAVLLCCTTSDEDELCYSAVDVASLVSRACVDDGVVPLCQAAVVCVCCCHVIVISTWAVCDCVSMLSRRAPCCLEFGHGWCGFGLVFVVGQALL
jgi:hypothetical protein